MGKYTKLIDWPIAAGLFVPTRSAELGWYADLLRICNHDGSYMESKQGPVWVEAGCALVSQRLLARRWDSNKSKVDRFINWCLDADLFYTDEDTSLGTWILPNDGESEPQNGPQNEPPNGPQNEPESEPQNEPQNKCIYIISKSWILRSRYGVRKRGCGGETSGGFCSETWHENPKIKFPPHLKTLEVIEVIGEWIDYRQTEIKKPVDSHRPINLIFSEVGDYDEAKFCKAIRFAMGKGWRGIERSWLSQHPEFEPQNLIPFRVKTEPQKSREQIIAEAEEMLRKEAKK